MKYFRLIVIALFLCSISVFSQDNNIKHTIVKGETVSSIAQKYNVSIASIYELNPKAKKSLQLNQVLLIPNCETKKTTDVAVGNSEKTTDVSHQVLTKETIYGITKQFKTTAELLYKANPQLEAEGLKIGQTIIIPSTLTKKEIADLSNSKALETEVAVAETLLTHQVKAKESMFAIAKMYGVSLKELQSQNPEIGTKGLSIGQIIVIPSNGKLTEAEVVAEEVKPKEEALSSNNKETIATVTDKSVNTKEVKTAAPIETTEILHEVLIKETKYGIAKKYGITVAELENQNPAIKQKLLVGSKLSIQVSKDKIEQYAKAEVVETKVESQAETAKETTAVPSTVKSDMPNEELINHIIEFASDNIGVRYRSGGTTNAGFDCSGLMCSSFGAFDIKLPRSSIEQASIGEIIDNTDAQKGDLIFFKTRGGHRINHVGMIVEVTADEIKFIHSSTHSGVMISSTKEPYYQRNFAQVNRVVK
jgi:cell wall-associated NlpC family hydrolase